MKLNEKQALIIEKIKAVQSSHKFIKQAKQAKINSVLANPDKADALDIEKIQNWDFAGEVVRYAFLLEKLDFVEKRLIKKVKKLETHTYAPELNKIWFKDDSFAKAPQKTSIDDALVHLAFTMSIEQLKSI